MTVFNFLSNMEEREIRVWLIWLFLLVVVKMAFSINSSADFIIPLALLKSLAIALTFQQSPSLRIRLRRVFIFCLSNINRHSI